MDSTLLALLRYTKTRPLAENAFSWTTLRDNLLAEIYHPEMRMMDVLQVVLAAWTQAAGEPRFRLQGHEKALRELLLAPVSGHFALRWPGVQDLSEPYTVEQFYASLLKRMLSDIMLARVDWCRDQVWPEKATAAPAA